VRHHTRFTNVFVSANLEVTAHHVGVLFVD
jgi:hypothetical protein